MERRRVTRQGLLRVARGRVLTTVELARALGIPRRNAAKAAFDLRRRGLLVRVQRGIYAAVPLDVAPDGFSPDPYLAAHKALGDRYAFSHFSAVALLGAEQQIRRGIHVEAPDVRPRRRTLGEVPVHVHSSPARGWERATTRVWRGGVRLRVTTPARTLVDLASLAGREQDYEGVLEAFRDLLPRVEPSDVANASLSTNSLAARARVGHYMGRALRETDGPRGFGRVLADLQRSVVRSAPTYVATRPRTPNNRFDAEFRVVYPGSV